LAAQVVDGEGIERAFGEVVAVRREEWTHRHSDRAWQRRLPAKATRIVKSVVRGNATAEADWLHVAGKNHRLRPGGYNAIRQATALVLLGVVIVGAWYWRGEGTLDPIFLQHFVRVHPIAAPLATILIYATGVLSGLPTLPLNLAAGVFWGPVVGGLISTIATTLGAAAAFATARSVFGRPLARRFDNKVVAHFQRELEEKGWRFLAFVRLNPIFPTGPLNYILGLTGIDSFTYIWATFVFILPAAIAVAFIGHSIGTFVVQGHMAHLIMMVMAVSAALTAMACFGYVARFLYVRREHT
jgi:uncharacterized membrane protein YdjX (TVP38/TMEM64 family)